MAHGSHGQVQPLGATCSTFVGGSVQILVPGPGTVVLSATVRVAISHTTGVDDTAIVVVSNTTTDCPLDAFAAVAYIPASEPTDGYLEAMPLLRPFTIPVGGSYRFYVNGLISSGVSLGDSFVAASLVATFYPS